MHQRIIYPKSSFLVLCITSLSLVTEKAVQEYQRDRDYPIVSYQESKSSSPGSHPELISQAPRNERQTPSIVLPMAQWQKRCDNTKMIITKFQYQESEFPPFHSPIAAIHQSGSNVNHRARRRQLRGIRPSRRPQGVGDDRRLCRHPPKIPFTGFARLLAHRCCRGSRQSGLRSRRCGVQPLKSRNGGIGGPGRC